MQTMNHYWIVLNVKIREFLNPYLGPIRRKRAGLSDGKSLTIISNNCWGGHVYRYFNLPYTSPTVGLYFFTEDYLKFLSRMDYYLSQDLHFITHEQSKYSEILKERKTPPCPIAQLGDIEIVFLHYHSEEEAKTKWNRRKGRMDKSHIIVKMTEQNYCTLEQLMTFDNLHFKNKIVFVHKDYGLASQIICKEFAKQGEVTNDTDQFRRHVNLIKLVRRVYSNN